MKFFFRFWCAKVLKTSCYFFGIVMSGSGESLTCDVVVPDTSVIIEGILSKGLERGSLCVSRVLVHEAVLSELEHQANVGKNIGFVGINEIDKIRGLASEKGFDLVFTGKKPSFFDVKRAYLGEVDNLIRTLAFEEDAVLLTGDFVQFKIAEARGIKTKYFSSHKEEKVVTINSFFDEKTMSVHLKEGCFPFAKKGGPGSWEFVKIGDKKLSRHELEHINRKVSQQANSRHDSFVEEETKGITIIQLSNFRIVITRPPFSDGWEITAVRPVKKLSLEDYSPSEKLMERFSSHAEGVLVAGSPGMGKSTFAQALAEFYDGKGKVVKTIEAPRDLVLGEGVTQYSMKLGSSEEIHDVLLLVRPDYTIFDEMRNYEDFKLFSDLRLSGIGLAGVVHATSPVDAIQRFVGKIELGIIPHVVDTVVFIKGGSIEKVLSLSMVVKTPEGMTEQDLARPVVVVNDFLTGSQEYEIYTYGEETVVIPLKGEGAKVRGSPSRDIAARSIEDMFLDYVDEVKVELVSDHRAVVYVPDRFVSKIIGKEGKNIASIEKDIGISIDVKTLEELGSKGGGDVVDFVADVTKKSIVISVNSRLSNKNVNIFLDDDFLLTVNVGKKGVIKLNKNNKIGKLLADGIFSKGRVKIST